MARADPYHWRSSDASASSSPSSRPQSLFNSLLRGAGRPAPHRWHARNTAFYESSRPPGDSGLRALDASISQFYESIFALESAVQPDEREGLRAEHAVPDQGTLLGDCRCRRCATCTEDAPGR